MLHFFNPENDLALAADMAGFTPPRAALMLRQAGALFPMWWANEDDAILVEDATKATEAEKLRRQYGLKGRIVMTAPADKTPQPWGWSKYTRRVFSQVGVPDSLLPNDIQLEQLRELSHRRTTIDVHKALGTSQELMPVEAFHLDNAIEAVDRFEKAVIKLPWSSSGRGVIYSSQAPRETLVNYIAGMINRQGSVTIEPHFDRVNDFATLFYCNETTVEYRGLSMFATDGRGFYAGNIVASQQRLQQLLGFDITPYTEALRQALIPILTNRYYGWVGVDMLTYRTINGGIEIAPCIEVNLRMTMGVAAMHVAQKIKLPQNEAILKVTPSGIRIE